MNKELYVNKEAAYFDHIRIELLDLIPKKNRNGEMLEIGAAGGSTLLFAKQHGYARKIYGIELVELQSSSQKSKEFENFIIGDIQSMELDFEENKFDVILCADVLEHLVDPYSVVKKLSKYLKEDGIFISAIPNIRHWRVLYDIVFNGDFRYVKEGILDKTHLRFFGRKNIIELFEENNFTVLQTIGNIEIVKSKSKILNLLTIGLFVNFLSIQYFVIAKKNNSGELE